MAKYAKILICLLILVSLFAREAPASAGAPSSIMLPVILAQTPPIYSTSNLAGHQVFGECNPGGGTDCPCDSQLDARIETFSGYGQVISNPRAVNTYVNAIGYKKFTETFPDGTPIRLGKYLYSGSFRLTAIPKPDLAQRQNGQAVHLMIQFWDGRNALYPADRRTLEGVIYWELNPWQADYGSIKIYVDPVNLIDTGVRLEPDLLWHRFTLAVDLTRQEYLYIGIDDRMDSRKIDLTGKKLARVAHTSDWGSDVSMNITTESMATWPQATCPHVFTWTTQFKDLSFSAIR